MAIDFEQKVEGKKQWGWYHSVLFYLLAQVLTFGLPAHSSAARRHEVISSPCDSSSKR